MNISSPYTTLVEKISSSLVQLEPIAEQAGEGISLSLSWVGHYLYFDASSSSAMILRGAYGCALESVTLTALGLVRPASLALRSHYELCLQYLYLKDHPREMNSLLQYRWQAPLPGAVQKYLREHSPHFEQRIQKLDACRSRSMDDVYGVLSGVAHGYALNSIPSGDQPVDLVRDIETARQCLPVFQSTGEALSDCFLSDFSSNWMSVPPTVRDNVERRMLNKSPVVELLF